MSATYQKGLWAETYAAWVLRLKGYKILEQRYKTPVGEVDLIARKKSCLVFVEVKCRPTKEEGLQSITPKMKSRISRAASHFLTTQQGDRTTDIRFDVVVVSAFRIWHLDNAWFPPT